jgi:diketogulonate reductase-like aldo/keto reductase
VNQIAYNVFQHNEATIQFCRANNITVEAYSPLGGAHGGRSVFKDPTIKSIAASHNVSAAQVALKWIVQRGDVLTALSSNKDHQANDADLFSFTISDDEMTKLGGIGDTHSDPIVHAETTDVNEVNVPTKEIAPGVQMPIVNIGTWVGGSVKPVDHNAYAITSNWLALGGRGVDTALIYNDQARVAKAIADSGIARKDIFITTKIPACSAAQSGIDSDLRALKTNYIDLLLIHSPIGVSCRGTWKVLEKNVRNGKLKAIGVSNFSPANLRGIMREAAIKPAVNQIAYNVFQHNEATIQFCRTNNITVEAYSPLGGAHGGRSVFKDPTIKSIAVSHNVSAAQVALKWIVQRGDVLTALSSNKDHQANDADLFSFTLSDDEMTKLGGIGDVSSDPIVV